MYSLQSLLEEVAKKRGRLLEKTKTQGQPSEDYAQVWDTLNRYVTACLVQKKGVNITNFCRVGWQLEKKRGNKIVHRPYFQLADSFCRAYSVDEARRAPMPPEKELCSMEEFNFSKAAIKYSQTLTKDVMFTGLRSIVQCLGEAISESKQINVDFEFGRLTCQNNDPRFVFPAEMYTQEGLPVPKDALDNITYNPSVSFQPPSKDALSLNIAGTKAGESDAPPGSAAPALAPPPVYAPPEAPIPSAPPAGYLDERNLPPSRGGESVAGLSYTKKGRGQGSERMTTASSRHSQGYAGSEISLTESQAAAKEEVAYREAMDRHIGEMEQRAAMAVFEKQEWEGHIKNCLLQEKDDIKRRRDLCEANSQFIKQQMDWNASKRQEGRKTFIENASAHDFPVFTEPPDNELQEQMKNQQNRLRSDLDTQVRTNNTLRNLARQRERELEHNQLEANRQEMAMLRSLDKSKKEHQKEVLNMAWNRDIRMRNIWKAIDGHGNSASNGGVDLARISTGADVMKMDGSQPPATPMSLAGSRSGSLPNLGRAMTGSQRRVPSGMSTPLEKQRKMLGA
jgi:hypothetical protein